MMRALLLAATLAVAGSAHAQSLTVDPKRSTNFNKPVPIRPGETVASDISASDFRVLANWNAEHFAFTGRAGETVSVRVRTDLPDFEVLIRGPGSDGAVLARGPAKDAAVVASLPADGNYFLLVNSKGPAHIGKYLMSFGMGATPPSLPGDTAAAVAEAPKPPSKPEPPKEAQLAGSTTPAAAPKRPPPLPMPKLTPPPGVLAAEIGKSIIRPAGKVGAQVDLFAFAGESGSVLQVSAGGPAAGGHTIVLYTPEGDEILTAEGVDRAELTAVLPKDGVYLLAVGRQNAANPYKLTLAADSPDLFQWSFRNLAGYEVYDDKGALSFSSCWTAPGATLRYTFANGFKGTLSVQRGGDGVWEFEGQGQKPFTTKLTEGVFVRTYADGRTPVSWSLDRPEPRTGAYLGYLCR